MLRALTAATALVRRLTSGGARAMAAAASETPEAVHPAREAAVPIPPTLQACIVGLPKSMTQPEVEALLQARGLSFLVVTKPKLALGFVTFGSAEDYRVAAQALSGMAVGDAVLAVKPAHARQAPRPKMDPALKASKASRKRKRVCHEFAKSGNCGYGGSCKYSHDAADVAAHAARPTPPPVDIRDVTVPLWRSPYATQLESKTAGVATVLRGLTDAVRTASEGRPAPPAWLESAAGRQGLACPLEGIVRSPSVVAYRNKCDFSIGFDAAGRPTVGFQLGAFKAGVTAVAEATECPHVSGVARAYAASVQDYIRRDSGLPAWDKRKNAGVWRGLVVREAGCSPPTGPWRHHLHGVGSGAHSVIAHSVIAPSVGHEADAAAALAAAVAAADAAPLPASAQAMVVVIVSPAGAAPAVFAAECRQLAAAIAVMAAARRLPLSVLSFLHHDGCSNAPDADAPLHHVRLEPPALVGSLAADGCIAETVLGLRFRVSAGAFFQTNTGAAEALYSLVGEWAAPSPGSLLIDVCCGTGTIGLTLAGRVRSLVGLELSAAAVADAAANAQLNGVTNATFVAGKAEETLKPVLESHAPYASVVVIVDPPRAGLHPSVLRLLRSCPGIDRLVYVSCNPATLGDNAAALCGPGTRAGEPPPWAPVRAMAVDQFPHTHHCEAVVVFERPAA